MKTHIHREGRRMLLITYVILIAINAVVFCYTARWLFAIILLLSVLIIVFITYFFRNPMRVIEVDDPNYLIAPADGHVVVIEPVMETEHVAVVEQNNAPTQE